MAPTGNGARDDRFSFDPDVAVAGAKRDRDVFAERLQPMQPRGVDQDRGDHALAVEDERLVVGGLAIGAFRERESAEPAAAREQRARPAVAPEPAGVARSLAVDAQTGAGERPLVVADPHGAARGAQLLVAGADVRAGEALVERLGGVFVERARHPRRRRAVHLDLELADEAASYRSHRGPWPPSWFRARCRRTSGSAS